MKENIGTIIKSMRLPFLILSPSCLFLAFAALHYYNATFPIFDFILIIIAALAAHISVNSFNEYFDFKSGLDEITIKTPFSGGSGGLLANPSAYNAVLASAIISLLISSLIGLYFIITQGAMILPMGLLGLVIIVTYTKWLNRSPLLCHLAPGLAFGPLMIAGTYYLLSADINLSILLISLLPFLLINNLLLLNQLPDIKADASIGRRTFPIVYGIENSLLLFIFNNGLAALVIMLAVSFKVLPLWAIITILPLLLSIVIYRGLKNAIFEISTQRFGSIETYLGMNVAVTVLTPVLLGCTLLFY